MKWMRKFFGRNSKTTKSSNDESVTPECEYIEDNNQYFSDEPIASKVDDRFGRALFAARIAETIAKRRDPSSIVIGLFGPWGDGKTSVLKMMEESLALYEQVITIRFNPWHFPSEDALLRGFFATLAEALGKEPAFKEKAAKLLESYGAILSVVSVTLPGVEINAGDAAKNIGESLSKVSLDQIKSQIDAFLGQSRKRLVILIDDIDRLDKDETNAILKLVKLSASFKYTSYVLAFDDDVVAAAIGERYGAGGHEAGRAFLEKIIQVPLHLPPVDRISLRQITFEGVEHALNQAGIVLDQRQADVFSRHFVDGLESKLKTPRVAKLYTNALMFALPLVKGEVNTAEFMLIEGIRVLYPKLYTSIRDSSEIFLKGEPRGALIGLERPPSPIDRIIEVAMPESLPAEREQIRDRLLKPLFPRTGNSMYGGDWEEKWAREKRICSARYFRRYFVYGVPEGDIADSHLNVLIEALVPADAHGRRSLLSAYSNRAMPQLIQALRDRVDSMGERFALPVAIAFAENGDLLPRERGPYVIGGTMMQAGILISQLMRCIPVQNRQAAVEMIVDAASPLKMGSECVRWLINWPDRNDQYQVLPSEANETIYKRFADRIYVANATAPIFEQAGDDAPQLYWYWQKGRGKEEVEICLREQFDDEPDRVDDFLETYIGEGWEIESGLPVRSDLRRETYDSIASLISPDYIAANLRSRYGVDLDDPDYYQEGTPAQIIAHQFVYIHKHALAEQQMQPEGGAELGPPSGADIRDL
ncbi:MULTISPECIES: P-loop NTPase fold protein [unclassified Pseudomonas]|uniref:KAP family P-loop NTPase fold protein n=1 Tax=unclassified Pseudomonas TaxID=196821 RepID=UPI000A1E8E6A|nr:MULTISPECIES: KAP family NTPase [unclassified Pseudomonas]